MLTKQKNLQLLTDRVSKLSLESKIVVAFDFDELVVPIHLTSTISNQISKPIDSKKLSRLGSCSFEGIMYLQSLQIGYNYEKYCKIRDTICKQTEWREGFMNLLLQLIKSYSVVFISSGFKDICETKLKEINFDKNNIIGCERKVDSGKISATSLIVTDQLKGTIIREIQKNHKVIAVGHSIGDKYMLDNADISISFQSDTPDLATHKVNSAYEILHIILNHSVKITGEEKSKLKNGN
ncbi:hypothetical protein KY320_03170 [Candidatus Woesearchaeota archaeon]|nr:hypothetical protein [Candidatus Woesearchaeota archaeon]